jgi:drug/metabolite transporter (DMT)-like permease
VTKAAAATHVPSGSRKSDLPGVGLVLVSAAGFGSLCVIAQLAYGRGVSVLGLLTGRYVIAGALLWLIALALRRPLPSLRGLGIGIALGAGYSSMALCFATSLHHIEAGLADLLLFAYPVLVAVGAVALGRERWHRRRAVALAAAATGIVLAVAGSGAISPLGVALALIAAAIYAAYVLASASLLGTLDPLVLAAAISTGAAMVVGADAGLRGQLAPQGGAAGLGLIVAAALFSSVLATSTFMAGVRRLGASRASIVSSAEPALTAVFAFAAFGQGLDLVQLLGATLVLASIPILELKRKHPSSHRRASRAAPSGPHHSLHDHNTEKGNRNGYHQCPQTAGPRRHPQAIRRPSASHPAHSRGDGAEARRH